MTFSLNSWLAQKTYILFSEDWESEFLNEMADYEVVKASKPDEQWNKELDELLKSCNEDSAESTPTE